MSKWNLTCLLFLVQSNGMLSIHVETQLTFCTKSCKLTSINLFVNYLCLLKFCFRFSFLYTSLYFVVWDSLCFLYSVKSVKSHALKTEVLQCIIVVMWCELWLRGESSPHKLAHKLDLKIYSMHAHRCLNLNLKILSTIFSDDFVTNSKYFIYGNLQHIYSKRD